MNRYVVAVLLTAAAVGLRLVLGSVLGPTPHPFVVVFCGAAIAAAWYGGFRAGLLSVALGSLAIVYLFIEPKYNLRIERADDLVLLVSYIGASLLGSWLCENLHAVRRRVAAATADERVWKARYEAAVESSGSIVYDHDYATRRATFGGNTEAVLGVSVGEMPKDFDGYLALVHPDDRAAFRAAADETAATGGRFSMEYRLRRTDGGYVTVQDDGRVLGPDDGPPARIIGLLKDVTEQRRHADERDRMNAALQETSEQLRLAVTAGKASAFSWDIPRNEVRRTHAIATALGPTNGTPETFEGVLTKIHPDDRSRFEGRVRAALSGPGADYHNEYRVVEPAGTARWMADVGRVEFGPDGGAVRLAGMAMDVTERKEAEVALRASEDRFRLAADAVDGIIYEYDFATGHVERSRGLYEVVGYRTDEVPPTAAWWWEQTHPDDRETNEKLFVNLVGDSVVNEYRVRHKDGRWLHVEDRAMLQRGDDGQVVKMIGCTVDVTERKEAEEQIRYSEQLHRVAFDQSPAGMVYVGVDGRFIQVNPAMCEIAGYPAEELVGMKVADLTHPDDRARDAELLAPFLRGDTPTYETDKRYVRKNGGVRWVSITARMVTDAEGRPLHSVGVAQDITDRKRAEQALTERTELLNGVLEGTTDVIFVKDLNGRIALVNAAFAAAARSTPEQLVGKTDEDLFPPDVAAAVRQLDEAVIAGGSPMQFEETIPVAGEPRVFLTLKAPLRDGDGRVVGVLGISRDITDRKRAEETLRASEARLRRVFESNVVGMIRWDLDRSLILDANAEFLRMTGYTRDDVTAGRLNFRDLTPAEWTARNEQGVRTIRADGHATPYEKEYFRKDGSRVPLIIAGTRFEDSPSEGMSFLIDISETKRAEERLRRNEERLRLIVESATGYAIFTMNTEGLIEGWNTGAERLFGYAEAEVVGQHDRILYTPEDAVQKIPEREMKKAEADGRAVNERWHAKKGGGRFWGSGLVQPLRDDGRIIGFLKIMQDMTEARLAEEQLRASEERRRLALDAAELGMWNFDPASGVVQTDARYRTIFGTTEECPHSLQLFAIIHPDDVSAVQEAMAAATRLEDPAPCAIEYRVVHPDGSHRWVSGKGRSSFEGAGPTRRVVSFDGTVADITDRKRSEEERERLVAQLRDADRRKDEFLATLAHELRNPLAPLRNGLQVIKLAGANGTVEQARSMMDRQLTQLVRLVDDLLDVSRITRGKLEFCTERVELRAVIDAAVETSRPAIEQAGHELAVVVPDEPIFVDGDAARLAQVVSNLLNNSAKYTHRGGHVRLTAGREGGTAVVSVKDDGIGIPPAMLGRVFEMFTQVDRTLEKTTGGLGIGLSLVKGLVEMHGGTIEARSEGEGRGSEFVVRLPVATEASVPPALGREENPSAPKSALRILVVDDNRDSADSLSMMLKVIGNDTRTAYDGEEAVAAAAEFRPAVILLDIGLPKLNGHEACRRIREQPWGKNMVIVAQTGWGQDEDRRRTHEAGFDHHLVKPVDPAALMKLLAGLKTATAERGQKEGNIAPSPTALSPYNSNVETP